MRIRDRIFAAAVALGAFVASASTARADIILESVDAGDMPTLAQGSPSTPILTAIVGALDGYEDADIFAFYIDNPADFSATTDGPDTVAYDTQLFLFDANGFGVAANDDIVNGGGPYNPRSRLPVGNSLIMNAGLYYLAVSGWDRDPHSAGGAMFTDDSNYAGVVGPAGPGGGQPISGWDGNGNLNGGVGAYTVNMTGARLASIPEPGAASLALLAMGLLVPAVRKGVQMRPFRQTA